MTVIAWDGHALAADKQATDCGLGRTVTKIHRIGDLLVSSCGNCSHGRALIDWVRKGRVIADFPKAGNDGRATLLVIENGRVKSYEEGPHPIELEDTFYACGSGRDYAMAALALGKTAVEAVQLACRFDTDCGMGWDVLYADTSESSSHALASVTRMPLDRDFHWIAD